MRNPKNKENKNIMDKVNNISLFSVSFKQGFVSPNIPIATFYQGEKKLNFLLDTGSDKNVINSKVLDDIKHDLIPCNGFKNVLAGFGGSQEVELHSITFTCEGEEYTTKFLAADLTEAFKTIEDNHNITLHGILGSIFLRENNIILDFTSLAAYSRK